MAGPQARAGLAAADEAIGALPDIFTALQSQLGLKLVKSKGFSLDTIVLDHVERVPTGN